MGIFHNSKTSSSGNPMKSESHGRYRHRQRDTTPTLRYKCSPTLTTEVHPFRTCSQQTIIGNVERAERLLQEYTAIILRYLTYSTMQRLNIQCTSNSQPRNRSSMPLSLCRLVSSFAVIARSGNNNPLVDVVLASSLVTALGLFRLLVYGFLESFISRNLQARPKG